jgi:threonine dehydrogenase-like Zn-dependent dehydrogenase
LEQIVTNRTSEDGVKAICIEGFGSPAKLVEIKEPEIGEDDVLIRVKSVALGRGEQNLIKGLVSIGGAEVTGRKAERFVFPHVPGFKGSGIVEEVGSNVSFLVPGDRVVINGVVNCRVCPECLSGLDNLCHNLHLIGLDSSHHGSLAEKSKAPHWSVYKIPSKLSFSEALLLSDMSLMVHTFDLINGRPGSKVAIFGIGLVGSVAIQVASASGFNDIICIDNRGHALEYARKIGAKETIHAAGNDVLDVIKKRTDGFGVDIAIDLVGEGKVIEQCILSVARKGTVALIANPKSVHFDFHNYCEDVIRKEITIRTVFGKCQKDFQRTIRLVEDGLIDTSVFNFKEFSILDFKEAAEAVLDLSHTHRIVINPS